MARPDGPRRGRYPRDPARVRRRGLGGLHDRDRFDAHLALGGGLDPTWLDLFSEAVRSVTGDDEPTDFLDARRELDGPGDAVDRIVERVDRRWIDAVARLVRPPRRRARRPLDRPPRGGAGLLPREEKPWIRDLAGGHRPVRAGAGRSPDVVFAWSL